MSEENTPEKQQSLYHVTADRELKPKHLIQKAGTIPFSGLKKPVAYPDGIDEDKATASHRFNLKNPDPFVSSIEVLPEAYKVETYAENMFVEEDEQGNCETDIEALKDVEGIDYGELTEGEGATVEELANDTETNKVHHIPSRKVVTDKRRQALRALGWNVKCEWQIASNRYTPLKVREFFQKKAQVCESRDMRNGFGWVRYRDYGGEVTITTIYPSKRHEISAAEEDEIEDREAINDDDKDRLGTADGEVEDKVALFGDHIRYNFMSKAKMEVKPVVYFPAENTMIPLDMTGKPLVRKQMGSLMEDIEDHHKEVLDRIDEFTQEIDEEIMDARRMIVDFTECEFTMSEFFGLLGLETDEYIESTVERVKDFAENAAKPSIWNLQLALKRTLIEDYNGDKASDRYNNFQAIAGKLLQYPETQVKLAVAKYYREQEDSTDEPTREDNQVGLENFDINEFSGVTENDIPTTEAEKVQNAVDSRL
jgi:hypothetical protein